jgi:hypothetical protein
MFAWSVTSAGTWDLSDIANTGGDKLLFNAPFAASGENL